MKILINLIILVTLLNAAIYKYDHGVGTGNLTEGTTWSTAWGSIDTFAYWAANTATADDTLLIKWNGTAASYGTLNMSNRDGTNAAYISYFGVKPATTNESPVESDFATDSADMPHFVLTGTWTTGDSTWFKSINFFSSVSMPLSTYQNNVFENCVFTSTYTGTDDNRPFITSNGVLRLVKNKFNHRETRGVQATSSTYSYCNSFFGDKLNSSNSYGVYLQTGSFFSFSDVFVNCKHGINAPSAYSSVTIDHPTIDACSIGVALTGTNKLWTIINPVITNCVTAGVSAANSYANNIVVSPHFYNNLVDAVNFRIIGTTTTGDPLYTSATDRTLQSTSPAKNGTKARQ